jgi:hypothetical protein
VQNAPFRAQGLSVVMLSEVEASETFRMMPAPSCAGITPRNVPRPRPFDSAPLRSELALSLAEGVTVWSVLRSELAEGVTVRLSC